MMKIGEL